MPSPVIELLGIRKHFPGPHGPVEVLHGLDLVVQPGEFVMITGPSGSGKSTVLNLVALLDRPVEGVVRFAGVDAGGMTEAERCRIRAQDIGMVFQKFHLLTHRSVLENVLFRWRYLPGDPAAAARARAALVTVGLDGIPERCARVLSAGEMQRVAIARAVAVTPQLLVADEPTGNLDRVAATAVMDCFRRLNAGGMTVLMVTHNHELLPFASRHLVCGDGRLNEGAR